MYVAGNVSLVMGGLQEFYVEVLGNGFVLIKELWIIKELQR